ncbi:MAG: CotH kinase family protein [Planctomycetota bacterium]
MPRKRALLTCLLGAACCCGIALFAAKPPGDRPAALLLAEFDADSSGWLNETERQAARTQLGSGMGMNLDIHGIATRLAHGGLSMPGTADGQLVEKDSVQPIDGDLYDTSVLRTIFIDFQSDDWENELESFHNTDVEVPATLTVDGEMLPNCGIRFRGASSYSHVSAGYKRSLNVSIDMADKDQRLKGYKTLNLLNGHGDESLMSTVLYSRIARNYLPTPKANFVRVVINGENWGIYTNVEQFNKDFLKSNFGTKKGARWKVHGSPRGGGGLDYRGENPVSYEHPYEQKSGGVEATTKLIDLCRILDQTSADELPSKLEPICDVGGLLWFLALDVGLMNGDGYWIRASDYSIYLDKDDKFHFIPHDMNEAFRPARGGGGRKRGGMLTGLGIDFDLGNWMGGGPGRDHRSRDGKGKKNQSARPDAHGGQSWELDPFIATDDYDKPLYSKVLAVPKYRQQFLSNLRTLASDSLDWNDLSAFVAQQRELIDQTFKNETHKLSSYEQFIALTSDSDSESEFPSPEARRRPRGPIPLKDFFLGRQKYLLEYEDPTATALP